jgi:orotate phosphoribosyltransferase
VVSLADVLVDADAFRTGEFELSSGETSSYYVDVKHACTDPSVLKALAQHAQMYAVGHDAVAGTALGGVPLAVTLGLEVGRPTLLVRDDAKEYGTGERIEGPIEDVDQALVVEDVTTTGNSLCEAAQAVREAGAEVKHAVTVVDREQGARELLEDEGVCLHALVTLSELTEAEGVEP